MPETKVTKPTEEITLAAPTPEPEPAEPIQDDQTEVEFIPATYKTIDGNPEVKVQENGTVIKTLKYKDPVVPAGKKLLDKYKTVTNKVTFAGTKAIRCQMYDADNNLYGDKDLSRLV